jgi:hypothetical protein
MRCADDRKPVMADPAPPPAAAAGAARAPQIAPHTALPMQSVRQTIER